MLNTPETESRPHGALTEEAKANLLGFLECIREIVDRLLARGFTIEDGKLIPPPPDHR